MLVFSDCPERLAGLAPEAGWSHVPVDALQPGDQALCRAQGMAEWLWRAESRDPGPPGFWARALVVAEAPSSQFDRLREQLAAGLRPPGPTACVALSGRSFHGQRGRRWLAAPGNLHLSAVVPEPGLAAREAASLPMLPALTLVDAIRDLSSGVLRPGVKWVNDVLVEGRKVGGALTVTQTQADRVTAILLGIGLNLALAPPVPPTPFVPAVGCLAEAGTRTTLVEAFFCVLAALGWRMIQLAEAPAKLLEAYRDASLAIGREVCVFADPAAGEPPAASPAAPVRGTVLGIGADLSLILEGLPPVASGRLAFAEDCQRFGL